VSRQRRRSDQSLGYAKGTIYNYFPSRLRQAVAGKIRGKQPTRCAPRPPVPSRACARRA